MPKPGESLQFDPLAAQQAANEALLNGTAPPAGASPVGNPASEMVATPTVPDGTGGVFADPRGDVGDIREALEADVTLDSTGAPVNTGSLPPEAFEAPPGAHHMDIPELAELTADQTPQPLVETAKPSGADGLPPTDPNDPETTHAPEPAPLELAEKHHNLKCPKCDAVQPASNSKCKSCGHALGEARKAKFANLSGETENVTIYQEMHLSDRIDKENGLIWKAVCKTGTLALSPGPGQTDLEQPLALTPDLFNELHRSVQEKAFPYVTIPETHANGVLENTGYVRETKIEDSKDPADPPGTKVLWAAMDFTEPHVREKAERGSIADTSVGVKFNYRNKRTGKQYAAALEHVALTNQPWVDGLIPFGQAAMLSQTPFDQEVNEAEYRGVYTELSLADDNVDNRSEEPDAEPEGDILPDVPASGTVPSMAQATSKPKTVEGFLASQQAQIEKIQADANAEIERLRGELKLAQGSATASAAQLHQSEVDAKVAALEGKVPPATLKLAQAIYTKDFRPSGEAPEGSLQLSVKSGDEVVEQAFGPTEILDALFASLPESAPSPAGDTASLVLDLSQATAEKPRVKDEIEQADDIERETHPERFDADGKRKEDV